MDTALVVNETSPDVLEAAKQAAAEIFSDSNTSFEKIKNRPWYKGLLNTITFQQGDKKLMVRNVRSLASLQSLIMEVYTNQLKSQDAELDSLMQQILSTQQFAYKMYISCVLQLKPQTDIDTLSEVDQQVLLLLLGEFSRSGCLDSEECEKLQQYNRGVSSSLCVTRPVSDLNPEQLEKVQFPDAFYRCVLEQCAVTDRLDPLRMPDNVFEAIQWLDISERKKERTLAAVKTEAKDFGIPFFFEKYKKPEPIFNESDLELAEDAPIIFDNEELPEQVSVSHSDMPDNEENTGPFHQLVSVIKRHTVAEKLGKPLLMTLAETDKNKLIAKVLPSVLPVSKTVVEIVKLKNGHLVFTTNAMYWATNKDVRKVPYSELQPGYLGTKPMGTGIAFVYTSTGNEPVEIMDSNLSAEFLERLLLEIHKVGEYAETDQLTEFQDLPQELQLTYMRFVANVIRVSGHSLHEVYRLVVQYDLVEYWDYISSEFEVPFEDAFRAYSEKIPYPNEDALAISMLKDICTIYQYTKDSDVLTTPEKQYFPLIFNDTATKRDQIIRYAQLEKQTIESRIDSKEAQAVTDAFSIAAGAVGASVLAYSGAMALFCSTLWFNFIPGIGTLISAAVVGGSIVSGILSSQNKKKLSEAEMRQEVRDKVMQSYQKAEGTARNQGFAEFADLLQREASTIAHRVGLRYGDYTQEERTTLDLIRATILDYFRESQKRLVEDGSEDALIVLKSAKLASDLSIEDQEKLLSSISISGTDMDRTDIVAFYDRTYSGQASENFEGMLFLSDCIYYRNKKSAPVQRMSYFNMLKIEKKWTSLILRGRNGDVITLDKNFPRSSLLQKIIDIVDKET